MAARVLKEMSVGLTPEIEAALNIAVEFEGIKASQFGRLAISGAVGFSRLHDPPRN